MHIISLISHSVPRKKRDFQQEHRSFPRIAESIRTFAFPFSPQGFLPSCREFSLLYWGFTSSGSEIPFLYFAKNMKDPDPLNCGEERLCLERSTERFYFEAVLVFVSYSLKSNSDQRYLTIQRAHGDSDSTQRYSDLSGLYEHTFHYGERVVFFMIKIGWLFHQFPQT